MKMVGNHRKIKRKWVNIVIFDSGLVVSSGDNIISGYIVVNSGDNIISGYIVVNSG